MRSFKSLIDNMAEYLPQFEEKVLPFPFERKGIWPSEAFAVCSLASTLGLDLILESGVLRGRSTEMFAKYGLTVHSVDRKWNETMDRFEAYPNVTIEIGDSTKILPLIGKGFRRKFGVFIDGPKAHGACRLARSMFKIPNVAFIGIHDQRIKHFHLMDSHFGNVVYTDEPCFRDKFGFLDNEAKNTPVPDRLPDPAGPTVGFVIKD